MAREPEMMHLVGALDVKVADVLAHPDGTQAGFAAAFEAAGVPVGAVMQMSDNDRGVVHVMWEAWMQRRPRTLLNRRASRTANTQPRWMRSAA